MLNCIKQIERGLSHLRSAKLDISAKLACILWGNNSYVTGARDFILNLNWILMKEKISTH